MTAQTGRNGGLAAAIRREARSAVTIGHVLIDLAAMGMAALVAYGLLAPVYAWTGLALVPASTLVSDRAGAFATTASLLCLYFLFGGHYHMRKPFWEETRATVNACAFALVIEGFTLFAYKADVSRMTTLATWVVAPFAIMWLRTAFRRLSRTSGGGATRVVVFGASEHAERAVLLVGADRNLAYRICGVHAAASPDDAIALLAASEATMAVLALSGADADEIALASALRRRGIDLCVVPPAMGISAGMDVQYILGQDAVFLVTKPEFTPRLSRAAKRLFDISVATALLAVLSVPMAVVSVAVMFDGGSPIFGHARVGVGGRTFRCLKFRSMRKDAESALAAYLASDEEARLSWERSRKLPDDPRITAIGRFIRKASIDELPQLVNVLKGEMSLVGPRPVTASELEHYGAAVDLYTSVKPGLTGLWQVSGRSDISYERRVAFDAWYVSNWSPWHDIAILAKTVPVVLGRGGAY
jgi:Undecaprenyl-phosphate galactose phosphotransferase WbaP